MTLLLDTLATDGVRLQRDGRWMAGGCPFCGGNDRFCIKPGGQAWICRGCSEGKYADVIEYVRRRDTSDYPSACRTLGLDPANPFRDKPVPEVDHEANRQPDEHWLERALEYVERCELNLWDNLGAKARSWLTARGLSDETLHQHRIGYFPGDTRLFGFGGPRAITIPWLLSGRLWGVRRRFPEGKQKYKWLDGSIPTIFSSDSLAGQHVAFLTEGEFDCMLLGQEAGDLAAVSTLGSASVSLHRQAQLRLIPLWRIFLALDTDKAGRAGAERLRKLSERMVLEGVPEGKDVTDFWRTGANLRDWVGDVLARHSDKSEQPAITQPCQPVAAPDEGWEDV